MKTYFTVEDVLFQSATDICNKKHNVYRFPFNNFLSFSRVHDEMLQKNGENQLIEPISSILLENNCKKHVWDEIETRPTSFKPRKDVILFCNDIVSNNGKLIIDCKGEVVDEEDRKKSELVAAAKCFLTTQRNMMCYDDDHRTHTISINDHFEYMVLLGEHLYKVSLVSPTVIWIYLSYKLNSSMNYDSAQAFDESHPQEHLYNMLKCAFNIEKVG